MNRESAWVAGLGVLAALYGNPLLPGFVPRTDDPQGASSILHHPGD